ncbi:hypothetical protein L1887_28942 [Cichorium endivia]|nr:hypothetical protein L1887_28942 [Cichorium endivia]
MMSCTLWIRRLYLCASLLKTNYYKNAFDNNLHNYLELDVYREPPSFIALLLLSWPSIRHVYNVSTSRTRFHNLKSLQHVLRCPHFPIGWFLNEESKLPTEAEGGGISVSSGLKEMYLRFLIPPSSMVAISYQPTLI